MMKWKWRRRTSCGAPQKVVTKTSLNINFSHPQNKVHSNSSSYVFNLTHPDPNMRTNMFLLAYSVFLRDIKPLTKQDRCILKGNSNKKVGFLISAWYSTASRMKSNFVEFGLVVSYKVNNEKTVVPFRIMNYSQSFSRFVNTLSKGSSPKSSSNFTKN